MILKGRSKEDGAGVKQFDESRRTTSVPILKGQFKILGDNKEVEIEKMERKIRYPPPGGRLEGIGGFTRNDISPRKFAKISRFSVKINRAEW